MYEDVWIVLYMFSRKTIVIDEKLKIKRNTLTGDMRTVGVTVKYFRVFKLAFFRSSKGTGLRPEPQCIYGLFG